MRYLYFIAVCCLYLSPVGSLGQTTEIKNLKSKLQQAESKKAQLNSLLDLCEQGYNLHGDTLLHYARAAAVIANNLKDQKAAVASDYYLSYAIMNKGLIDSAFLMANKALKKMSTQTPDHILLGKIYNQLGRCQMRRSEFKEAIGMGLKVIEEGEKAKDTLLQMQGKTLNGWAYLEMGRNEEALSWHLKALNSTNNENLREKYSILFANLALNYNVLGKRDSALYYIEKAVHFSRKHESLFGLSNSLAIKGQFLVRMGNSLGASEALEEAVKIRELIGDPYYIVSDMAQLSIYYASNNETNKGIKTALDGIAMAKKFNVNSKLIFLYGALAENYRKAGNYDKYAQSLEELIVLNDSVYKSNSFSALEEVKSKYELQKKENTIIQQKLRLTQKNYLIYGSLLFTLLALIASWALFNGYKKRQKLRTKTLVEHQKRKLEEKVKEAEENERKRIAADLHDSLGVYAASISSNLDYISVKEKDTKNSEAYLALRQNANSIITQLNDTIWVMNKKALLLTAISDRIKIFVQRLQPSYPHIDIEVIETIERDCQLSSTQAFHLYRIIQEGLSNALKHSGCNAVQVMISGAGSWQVKIADNGTGFELNTEALKEGNGIANIKSRCREEAWEVEWITNTQGTSLNIKPTTN